MMSDVDIHVDKKKERQGKNTSEHSNLVNFCRVSEEKGPQPLQFLLRIL